MQTIVDFMLLAASASAAVYCFMLSGKLKKLNDLRSGLGASIASMSLSLEQTRRMLDETKISQRQAEENLRTLIEDAGRTASELSDLVDAIIETAELAAGEIAANRDEALAEIDLAKSAPARIVASSRKPRRENLAA